MILCLSESIYLANLAVSCLCVSLSSYRSILHWRNSFFSNEITYSIEEGSCYFRLMRKDDRDPLYFVDCSFYDEEFILDIGCKKLFYA
jgi:hypothetical protein